MKYLFPLTFLILLSACTNQTTGAPSSISHFPQQINTPNVYMQALIEGELILENGCLRVNDLYGNSILLIWRPGFSTRTEEEIVQVVDSNTDKALVSVGDFVAVGGGFDDNPTWMGLTEPLPEECPGPYFIVGESIKKIDKP